MPEGVVPSDEETFMRRRSSGQDVDRERFRVPLDWAYDETDRRISKMKKRMKKICDEEKITLSILVETMRMGFKHR